MSATNVFKPRRAVQFLLQDFTRIFAANAISYCGSFTDVAAAFEAKLGHPVAVEQTPRQRWETAFRAQGFSPGAAKAYAKMTALTVDYFDQPHSPRRGQVSLFEHIAAL